MSKLYLYITYQLGGRNCLLASVFITSLLCSGQLIAEQKYLWSPITFTDVAQQVGIDTQHIVDTATPMPPLGTGAAWADYDMDGDLDLYVTNFGGANRLYRNDGAAGFTDVAKDAGVQYEPLHGTGVTFVDFDNDGDKDLHVLAWGADVLYENIGGGQFRNISTSSGVAGGEQRGTAAAWGDYDNDGYLDLYVVNHYYELDPPLEGSMLPRTPAQPRSEDRFYHNNGNGTFTNVIEKLVPTGSNQDKAASHVATFFDYDLDGDIDLFIGTDCGLATLMGDTERIIRNALWRNDGANSRGKWVFTDVSSSSNIDTCQAVMGTALGDVNNDGYFDIGITGPAILMINNKDGSFTQVSGAAEGTISWGVGFYDFDNNGWKDVHYVAGNTTSTTEPQEDAVFMNKISAKLWSPSVKADIAGVSDGDFGRTSAYADYDQDGFVDVLVVNRGGLIQLYKNEGETIENALPNWLTVELEGTISNRDAVGAKIAVTAGTITQWHQVRIGSSYGAGDMVAAHFGLRNMPSVTSIEIYWPSGIYQKLDNIKVNQWIKVKEPDM